MCSRHQSKYTRSLHLVTNTLFMTAFIDFMRSLGDQWQGQPFSKFTCYCWVLTIFFDFIFYRDTIGYSLLQVGIVWALCHLLRVAIKRKCIPDVTEWKDVDPTTLEASIHAKTKIMMTFSYAEKNDPPDEAKRADPNYYKDIVEKRAKYEAQWEDYTTFSDDVPSIAAAKRSNERAGGANPSPAGGAHISNEARRAEICKILEDSQAAVSEAPDARPDARPNARGKSPGAQVRRAAPRGPTCNVCHVVGLTSRFVGTGMCGGCTKKSQPKKKK